MATNTYGAAGDLRVGGSDYRIFRLSALDGVADLSRLPYSIKLLLENLLRNEDGVDVARRRHRGARRLRHRRSRRAGDRLLAGAHPPPGLHRRALRRRPRRDARRRRGARRRRRPGQPARPGRPRDRPLRRRRRLRPPRRARRQHARSSSTRNAERYRFLRWGQQALLRTSASSRRARASATRSTSSTSRSVVFTDDDGNAYPDTVVGTDSHTPMVNGLGVARLGRRRHRGGGGDARPADLDARAPGRRPPPARRAPRGHDRDRPRAHGRRAAAAATASSASSSSATARASPACRSRTGRRSATCRPSTARR